MAVQPPVNALNHLDIVTSNYVQTQVFWPKNYALPPPRIIRNWFVAILGEKTTDDISIIMHLLLSFFKFVYICKFSKNVYKFTNILSGKGQT